MMVVYKIMRFVEAPLGGAPHLFVHSCSQADRHWVALGPRPRPRSPLTGRTRSCPSVLRSGTAVLDPRTSQPLYGWHLQGSATPRFFQPVHCYFFFRDEVIMRVGVGEDGGEGGEEGDPWELTAPSFTFRRPRAHRLRQTGSDGFRRIGGFLAF